MSYLIALLFAVTMQSGGDPCALNPVRVSACLPSLYAVGTNVSFAEPFLGYAGGVVTGYYLQPDTNEWAYAVTLAVPAGALAHEHFVSVSGVVPR